MLVKTAFIYFKTLIRKQTKKQKKSNEITFEIH